MALDLYRSNYRPSARHPVPQATICVWALAAETEAEARRLLKTRELWRNGFEQGIRKSLITPKEADAFPYTAEQRATIEKLRQRAVSAPQSRSRRAYASSASGCSSPSSSSSPGPTTSRRGCDPTSCSRGDGPLASLIAGIDSVCDRARMMRRIAAPMVGGMISSIVLTLVVIPAIYALVTESPLRRRAGRTGRETSATDVSTEVAAT